MKEKFIKYKYEKSIVYVGNQNTLGVQTKDMVVPFLTDLKEAQNSMLYWGKGQNIFDVPVRFIELCIEDSNKRFSN